MITQVQGRTDTFTVEAKSLEAILSFYDQVSTAKVTMVKEIVYQKQPKLNTNYNYDEELRILAKSKDYTNLIILKHPKTNLSLDKIAKSVKSHLTINGQKIISILNIIKKAKS